MRQLTLILLSIILGYALFVSCNKWKDPAPVNDPRLTNLYCNNPTAVNYNIGFPGKPDNSVCFFPSDLFQGSYILKDSVYVSTSGLFLRADSIEIRIAKIDDSFITVVGFCSSGTTLRLKAGPTYVATIDTLVGNANTPNKGQILCRIEDTVSGTITKDRVDSSLLHVFLTVAGDTGITVITGNARKK